MKVKREDLFKIDIGLDAGLSLEDSSAKFKIRALKNKRLISGEIEDTRKAAAPSVEYINYERARIKLCEDFAEKDEEEKAIVQKVYNNEGKVIKEQYKIAEEEQENFEKKMEELVEENKETIEEHEKQEEEVKAMLEEEIEIPFAQFSENIIPDSLDSDSVDALFDLIS